MRAMRMQATPWSAVRASAALGLLLGLTSFSTAGPIPSQREDGTSPLEEEGLTGAAGPAALEPFALIGKASSFNTDFFPHGVETIVQVHNDDTVERTVHVEWLYRLGTDDVAGISGPFTIAPGTSRTFGTHNVGEPDDPFIVNLHRDTTQDFVGRAKVYADPGGFLGLTLQAFQVSGQGNGAFGGPESVSSLRAYRIKSGSGSARQAGD